MLNLCKNNTIPQQCFYILYFQEECYYYTPASLYISFRKAFNLCFQDLSHFVGIAIYGFISRMIYIFFIRQGTLSAFAARVSSRMKLVIQSQILFCSFNSILGSAVVVRSTYFHLSHVIIFVFPGGSEPRQAQLGALERRPARLDHMRRR